MQPHESSPTRDTDAAKWQDDEIEARGPISRLLLTAFSAQGAPHPLDCLDAEVDAAVTSGRNLIRDDDVQLSLFLLYGLHYGAVVENGDLWEWDLGLLAARRRLENAFESQLRAQTPIPELPNATAEDVAAALFELTSDDSGPSVARFVAKSMTPDQADEFMVLRSIYTLKEADPHSWAIPRLRGRAKAALVEIQADEYGGGRHNRMHAEIFARSMRAMGLDSRYAAYVNFVPALTLASFTMMSMFGIHRRLRGAIVGHLAAFEMTSSIPNGFYARGFRRLGHGDDVTHYFDEHVEADAVHEQIAARDLAGGLAESEPALLSEILFGASAGLLMDRLVGEEMLSAWTEGRSALRKPLTATGTATSPRVVDAVAEGASS